MTPEELAQFGDSDAYISTVTPLLTHNNPPLDQVAAQLGPVLAEAKSQVHIAARCPRTDQVVNTVFAKMKKIVHDLSLVLSPSRRIPSELVQRIFVFTTYSPHLPNLIGPANANSNRTELRKVCSEWNCVALSTPEIWSTFSLSAHGMSVDEHEARRVVCRLRRWLVLGKDHGLTMALNFSTAGFPDGLKMAVLSLLLCYIPRWKDVRFTMDASILQLTDDALTRAFETLSSLECIIVDVTSGSKRYEARIDLDIRAFSEAPRLSQVSITNKTSNTPLCFHLPAANLHTVKQSGRGGFISSLDLINSAAHLVTLNLTGKIFYFTPPAYKKRLTLPSLRSLSIRNTLYRNALLLKYLDTPSLRNLTILKGNRGVAGFFAKQIADLQMHSGCAIESLDIREIPLPASSIAYLLRSLYTLTDLSILLQTPLKLEEFIAIFTDQTIPSNIERCLINVGRQRDVLLSNNFIQFVKTQCQRPSEFRPVGRRHISMTLQISVVLEKRHRDQLKILQEGGCDVAIRNVAQKLKDKAIDDDDDFALD
jgi:hypothetical protein